MICKKIMDLRYKTVWHVAIRRGEAGQILKDFDSVWHVLESTKNHWCADPFLFIHLGEVYVFAEYYDLKLKKGAIGYTKYDSKTEKCDEWKEIIVEDFHLSFPFIYEEKGDIYIIPACTSGNFVRYKAISFPDIWEQEILVKNVEFADTVIYKFEDYYIGYTLQRHAFGKEDKIDRARLFTIKGTSIVLESEFYSDDPRIRRLAGGGI